MDLMQKYDALCAQSRESWPSDAMVSCDVQDYPDPDGEVDETLDVLDLYARLSRLAGIEVVS